MIDRQINALCKLGDLMAEDSAERARIIEKAGHSNPWFTRENVLTALNGITANLRKEEIETWLGPYACQLRQPERSLNIGLVLAGNIPMVGFHDILCVLVSGHRALIKMSSQDNELTSWMLGKMGEADQEYASRIQVTNRLENPEAIIATGSNNSSRYFEHYFGKYPHIIRKNRNSVAILTGEESMEELQELGKDIFRYFGMGCRNVSGLLVPPGYNFETLFKGLEPYQDIMQHHKYANNYDYQLTIRLMKRLPHVTNGFLLLAEDPSFASPMATLHYTTYRNRGELQDRLRENTELLQCVVSAGGRYPDSIPFGQSQQPSLRDYADGVDTLKFLISISR